MVEVVADDVIAASHTSIGSQANWDPLPHGAIRADRPQIKGDKSQLHRACSLGTTLTRNR